jgi:GntR family transcriptional regulator
MNITISTKDGVPIYRQIANQIRYMVASSLLQPGEEISPVRTLALALNVTPNTVVKAYDELQAAGVIFKRRGAGTYISDEQSPLAERERRRIIEARIDALLAEAHQLDFDAHDLLELVRDRQTQLGEKKQAKNAGSEKNDE